MNKHTPSDTRVVSLFRNGRNQAIRIPVEFELPGDEATIRREGDRLIIEAKRQEDSIAELLASWGPLGPEDEFPDVDENLGPLRDVNL